MPLANPGTKITAGDYIGLRTRVNEILGDAGVVQHLGYGQVLDSLSLGADDVLATRKILTSQWIALRNDIDKVHLHQTGDQFTNTELVSVSTGDKIEAAHVNSFDECVNIIVQNPLDAYVGSMSSIALGSPKINSTPWGGTGGRAIVLEDEITFTEFNKARYFFNSGGAIRYSLTHSSSANAYDEAWQTALASMGTISIKAMTSSLAGGANDSSLGFYNLNSSWQRIFSFNGSGGQDSGYYGGNYGGYTGNSVEVAVFARRIDATINFRVVLNDRIGGDVLNNITGSTSCSMSAYKAVTPLLNIETPSVSRGEWTLSATTII